MTTSFVTGKAKYCYFSSTSNGTTTSVTPNFNDQSTANPALTALFCLATTSAHINITGGQSLYAFLGNDTYYPSVAQGTRYSKALFSPYSRYDTDCIHATNGGAITLETAQTLTNAYGVLFYLDQNGIVNRNKEGFLCEYYDSTTTTTAPTLNALPPAANLVTEITNFRNTNPTYMMILYGYQHMFQEYGFSSVLYEANATYYVDPPLDSRSPKDYSRRGGLKNICGSNACNGNTFEAHNGGTGQVHDVYYQAQVMNEIVNIAQQTLSTM